MDLMGDGQPICFSTPYHKKRWIHKAATVGATITKATTKLAIKINMLAAKFIRRLQALVTRILAVLQDISKSFDGYSDR